MWINVSSVKKEISLHANMYTGKQHPNNFARKINYSVWINMYFVEGAILHQVRCEFSANDFLGADSEAFLISSAFIPQESIALMITYSISSPDTAVQLLVISQFTKQVIQRHSLSQHQSVYFMKIPSTFETIYVVLGAYRGISTSSVTIIQTWLIRYNDS